MSVHCLRKSQFDILILTQSFQVSTLYKPQPNGRNIPLPRILMLRLITDSHTNTVITEALPARQNGVEVYFLYPVWSPFPLRANAEKEIRGYFQSLQTIIIGHFRVAFCFRVKTSLPYKAIHVKVPHTGSFSCKSNSFHMMRGFAGRLVLKQRHKVFSPCPVPL